MSFCFRSLSLPLALQNKFSSKIAIKSLWKFMSIVAAICRRGEKKQLNETSAHVANLFNNNILNLQLYPHLYGKGIQELL